MVLAWYRAESGLLRRSVAFGNKTNSFFSRSSVEEYSRSNRIKIKENEMKKAQENNADRKSPFWFQAYEIPYGLSRKYIYLYNFYSSANVVDSSVIGLGLFRRVTHKFTKCLFRRWMSDKKKYLYIFFNKKTNQNSLNFVSMRFFHHRVMFFSLLLRCWYFISFLSPILAFWISVLYSVWGHSNHQIPYEIWKICAYHHLTGIHMHMFTQWI